MLLTWPPPGTLFKGAKLALGLVDPTPEDDVIHSRALFWWALFGLLACALVAARARGRLAGGTFAVLAVALACADLFRAGAGFNPAISTDVASLPTTPAIRYLQDRRPARFVAFDRGLAPNQAMRYGLYDARNYDFPIEKRYDVIWRRYVFPLPYQPGAPQWVLTVTPAALRVLGLLGVTRRDGAARRGRLRAPDRDPAGADLGLDGLRVGLRRARRADLPQPAGAAARVRGPRAAGGGRGRCGAARGRRPVRARPRPRGGDASSALPGLARRPARRAPSPARIVSYSPQRVVVETRAGAPGPGRPQRRGLPRLEGP